jgi:23S rRNA pseudouridine2605 synthase
MASNKDDNNAVEGERIAKAIARAGLASRREAEAWIVAGRVSVNGAVISSPALNVNSDDRVTVDGRELPTRERTRLFLFNKPRGLVTTHVDPQGRPTVFAALPKHLPRLISVGRLDANTEGLLLLTNDGGLARLLELPSTGWTRRYRVRANGKVTQEKLDTLRRGITIDGVRYGPIEARLDREQGANVWLMFAMREGKNREVKNVLGHLGLAVNRLIRVSFGPFQLGDLADGAVEEVRTRHLREQLGDKLSDAARLDFAGPVSLPPSAEGRREPPGRGRDSEDRKAHPASRRSASTPVAGSDKKPRREGERTLPGRDKKPRRESESIGKPERARRDQKKSHREAEQKHEPQHVQHKRKKKSRVTEHVGEPERARRERKRGRRPFRSKSR